MDERCRYAKHARIFSAPMVRCQLFIHLSTFQTDDSYVCPLTQKDRRPQISHGSLTSAMDPLEVGEGPHCSRFMQCYLRDVGRSSIR